MTREMADSSAPPRSPLKGSSARIPAATPLISIGGNRAYALRPAKKTHTPQPPASTTPAAISEHTAPPTSDTASVPSVNDNRFLVTPPSERRSTPEQQEGHLKRQSSTTSTNKNQDSNLKELSSSRGTAQASQIPISPTSSLSGRVSKRSSQSSSGRRQKEVGPKTSSIELKGLAHSTAVADKEPSERDFSPLAKPRPGRRQRSQRQSARVLRRAFGSVGRSVPSRSLSQHSTRSRCSNSSVASRVSKGLSTAEKNLRIDQRARRRRLAIERCLTLVSEADVRTYDTRAQRFSIAKQNTETLLNRSMNYAYHYLRSIEPNLPDITLDGLEAIVNDLVHIINYRDPSRRITIRGGRLNGQLIDESSAKTLQGYIMSCEQDTDFDPIIQSPGRHVT